MGQQNNKKIAGDYIKSYLPLFKSRIFLLLAVILVAYLTSFKYVFVMLLFLIFYQTVIKSKDPAKKRVVNFLKSSLQMSLFFAVIWLAGPIGASAVLLIIVLYFLWKGRAPIIKARNLGEEMMFGKTLDKENWTNERPRIRWKKKKQ